RGRAGPHPVHRARPPRGTVAGRHRPRAAGSAARRPRHPLVVGLGQPSPGRPRSAGRTGVGRTQRAGAGIGMGLLLPRRPAPARPRCTPSATVVGLRRLVLTVAAPANVPPRTARTGPDEVLRRLDLAVAHKLDGLLHGEYQGLVPGHGSELGETRSYSAGDD